MKSKKDVIIIEENPHFTNKLKEKLEDKEVCDGENEALEKDMQ